MKKYLKITSLLVYGLLLISCGDGDDDPSTNIQSGLKVASAVNGKIYYQHNCGGCHSAGDDKTVMFNAIDLAQNQDKIKTDMSEYGGFYLLMGRFTHISQIRVDELKAYFKTL